MATNGLQSKWVSITTVPWMPPRGPKPVRAQDTFDKRFIRNSKLNVASILLAKQQTWFDGQVRVVFSSEGR